MSSRRRFLSASLAAAAAWRLDASSVARLLAQAGCEAQAPPGALVDVLPVTGDRPRATAYGELLGGPGLERRRFTDISNLRPGRLITPSSQVFLRTDAPPGLADRAPGWQVALGSDGRNGRVAIDELRRLAVPQGVHLIECAGNTDPNNFGLLSAVEWSGVPLTDIVSRLAPGPDAWGVLVTGEDHAASARFSVPGASWILPLADLPRLGAFLATEMNGAPLPLDHGAPVRLVVPGWYACAWIKWVREIALVDAGALVTWQMAEYASRTHQEGRPLEARDYEPPVIDLAAAPIRVERRRVDGALQHHVIGIVWGGSTPVSRLEIRFNVRDPWKPLEICPPPTTTRAWSLWTYRWTPPEPGIYNITLRCPDPSVRTRRLDLFFYARRVRIDEV
ncbi:MAG: molybdopterin-dependent oxidoreductase [Acidobacteria bacterium]|nr:molybdopterin-dependent oxidoreductase [Acidobacteriota bacterium]